MYEGFGKFTWSNGNTYEGSWKQGRIDGNGNFRHLNGERLQGQFRNFYYLDNQGNLINPFQTEQERQTEKLQRQAYLQKLKEDGFDAVKTVKIFKVSNQKDLIAALDSCDERGRVPVLLATTISLYKKDELYEMLKFNTKNLQELDLRALYLEKKSIGPNKEKIKEKVRVKVLNALTTGGILVLNIDDSSVNYEEIYDPDVAEFMGGTCFPVQLFNPNEFKQKYELWKIFSMGKTDINLNRSYKFIVWSKYRIDHELDEQDLLGKFERRFGRSLNLNQLDLIIFNEAIVEAEEEEENAFQENSGNNESQMQK